MKHKALAILLIALLGGMALYYNKSASQSTDAKTGQNANSDVKVEPSK